MSVDRVSLREALDREGIAPSSYSLDGDDPDNRYVLAVRPGAWGVLFYARGREMDRVEFDTEDEACSDFRQGPPRPDDTDDPVSADSGSPGISERWP